MYEIWRQRNPESRMYMDAKKLMNQKNYILKHNKITEMEIEEIKKELQANQRSHLEEGEEEELEYLGTIRDREQKPNTAFTIVEETEIHQQMDQIYKLKEKNWKYLLSGDTNSNWQQAKITETPRYVKNKSNNENG